MGKVEEKDSDVVVFNMNITRALRSKFKSKTASEGKEMTEIIIDFIEDYVK
jgi:hypothetical protein